MGEGVRSRSRRVMLSGMWGLCLCVSGGRRRLIFGDEGLRINPPSVQEVRSLCMSIMY